MFGKSAIEHCIEYGAAGGQHVLVRVNGLDVICEMRRKIHKFKIVHGGPMARHQGAIRWDLPSLPTTKLMSDINSLLNIAALRSRTVGFVACQFGSPVSMANKLFGI